ncbi:low molecular weight protein-tyrosine-phosphatase [Telmatospirillum sp.]|uniref:low molecular weight protein-tyrosine-phosphatase n=1 Tax=Telmatospirillum sp. TaxID=2079197 RepID=UPI00284C8A2C|nr:low molecular weight protein-tyrosine-phosphatase [Telmatospirillum sp.]MDR3439554.1 low molecular weight phosphotyrosine protein phosphatase [Telmatospirillum sp.]
MVKVLFVCTGNICRSPTAHGLLRAQVAKAGLDGRIIVDSAGTHGYHNGQPPDPRSIATARQHGIDLSDLRARQVTDRDFAAFDIIAAMERTHERALRLRCPPALSDRISLLMDFAADPTTREVIDPYYGDEGFETVYQMIEAGVAGLLDHIRSHYSGI